MKTLSVKSNKLNINNVKLPFLCNIYRSKSVVFFANEKQGKLSPLAIQAFEFCKENGFELISRPVGKCEVNFEYFDGKMQDVNNQLTSYTIK